MINNVINSLENNTPVVDTPDNVNKVKVPNVVGKTESEAKKALDAVKLRYKIEHEVNDEKVGIVIRQTRKAGEEVKEDTIVTLIVGKKSNNNNNIVNKVTTSE